MKTEHLLLKVSAALSILSFYLFSTASDPASTQATFVWQLYAVPSALVLLLPRRLVPLSRGIAIGQAVFVLLLFLQPILFGLASLLTSRSEQIGVSVLAIQLLFVFLALRAGIPLPNVSNAGKALVAAGAIGCIAFFSIITGRLADGHTPLAPDAIYRVVGCAESYRATHGEYAESLRRMAVDEGINCIYPFRDDGRADHGRLEYRPERDVGRVTGYSIVYGAEKFWGRFRNDYFVDQTGIVHASRDGKTASAEDPVISNVTAFLHTWEKCLVDAARAHVNEPFPAHLADMNRPDWPCRPTWTIRSEYLEPTQFYRVYYQRDDSAPERPRSAFHLIARPDRYAFTGVRCYYADETGVIRGTPENREAKDSDPPIPECEWNPKASCPH
jgi:hypothetical protein